LGTEQPPGTDFLATGIKKIKNYVIIAAMTSKDHFNHWMLEYTLKRDFLSTLAK
jgi:hypothetical protein